MGKVLFGGVVGALIAFVCGFISWVVLPWHSWTLQTFPSQEVVNAAFKSNLQKEGMGALSYAEKEKGHLSTELGEKGRLEKEKGLSGPLVRAQGKKKGFEDVTPQKQITSFLTQFIGASLVGIILTSIKRSSYMLRLSVVVVVSLAAGVLGYVPHWNRLGGGYLLLLVNMADLVATWFLVGLVMAAFFKPKPERRVQTMSEPACQ